MRHCVSHTSLVLLTIFYIEHFFVEGLDPGEFVQSTNTTIVYRVTAAHTLEVIHSTDCLLDEGCTNPRVLIDEDIELYRQDPRKKNNSFYPFDEQLAHFLSLNLRATLNGPLEFCDLNNLDPEYQQFMKKNSILCGRKFLKVLVDEFKRGEHVYVKNQRHLGTILVNKHWQINPDDLSRMLLGIRLLRSVNEEVGLESRAALHFDRVIRDVIQTLQEMYRRSKVSFGVNRSSADLMLFNSEGLFSVALARSLGTVGFWSNVEYSSSNFQQWINQQIREAETPKWRLDPWSPRLVPKYTNNDSYSSIARDVKFALLHEHFGNGKDSLRMQGQICFGQLCTSYATAESNIIGLSTLVCIKSCVYLILGNMHAATSTKLEVDMPVSIIDLFSITVFAMKRAENILEKYKAYTKREKSQCLVNNCNTSSEKWLLSAEENVVEMREVISIAIQNLHREDDFYLKRGKQLFPPEPLEHVVSDKIHEPKVGIFLLLSEGRWNAYLKDTHVLANTLRLLFIHHPSIAKLVRLHILVAHPILVSISEQWVEWLGEAASIMFGGVHLCPRSEIVMHASGHNYMRKQYTAAQISRQMGYTHIISLDDDVILPPAVLHFMIKSRSILPSPAGIDDSDDVGDSETCALLTPSLSTGVPTYRFFAESFLTKIERDEMEECFRRHGHRGMKWTNEDDFFKTQWQESMSKLVPKGAENVGFDEYMGGLHPVRSNKECLMKMANFTAEKIETKFLKEDNAFEVVKTRQFPYLANSIWMATIETFELILQMPMYTTEHHPYDERAMNVFWRESQRNLCIVNNSFGIHPAYNTISGHMSLELQMHSYAASVTSRALKIEDSKWVDNRSDMESLHTNSTSILETNFGRPIIHEAHGNCAREKNDSKPIGLTIFIHVCRKNRWEEILIEILSKVISSGLLARIQSMHIISTGGKGKAPLLVELNRKTDLIEKLNDVLMSKIIFDDVSEKYSIRDYELPTLSALHKFAQSEYDYDPNHLILYLHTKGVGTELAYKEDWRSYMLYFLVEKYCICLDELSPKLNGNNSNKVACGVEILADDSLYPVHFSGNFWWAKVEYITTLPEPHAFMNLIEFPNGLRSWRHNQEFWITSKGNGKTFVDLWQSGISYKVRPNVRQLRSSYANDELGCQCNGTVNTTHNLTGSDTVIKIVDIVSKYSRYLGAAWVNSIILKVDIDGKIFHLDWDRERSESFEMMENSVSELVDLFCDFHSIEAVQRRIIRDSLLETINRDCALERLASAKDTKDFNMCPKMNLDFSSTWSCVEYPCIHYNNTLPEGIHNIPKVVDGRANMAGYTKGPFSYYIDGECTDDDVGDSGLISGIPLLLGLNRAGVYGKEIQSVLDVGGGRGIYIHEFAKWGLSAENLIVMEPSLNPHCLRHGLTHEPRPFHLEATEDMLHLGRTFDLVMSIEAGEHIPAHLHQTYVDFLVTHTRKFLIFSAAFPGVVISGHSSCKYPFQWRDAIENAAGGNMRFSTTLTNQLRSLATFAGYFKGEHLLVFQKTSSTT